MKVITTNRSDSITYYSTTFYHTGAIQDKIKVEDTEIVPDGIPALMAFRSTFLLFFFTVLISWNTYGWRNAGVNHILIFEIDPRNHLNYLQLLTVRSYSYADELYTLFQLYVYSQICNPL